METLSMTSFMLSHEEKLMALDAKSKWFKTSTIFSTTKRCTSSNWGERKAHPRQEPISERRSHSSPNLLLEQINSQDHKKETSLITRNTAVSLIRDLEIKDLRLNNLDRKVLRKSFKIVPSSLEQIIRMCQSVFCMTGSAKMKMLTSNSSSRSTRWCSQTNLKIESLFKES